MQELKNRKKYYTETYKLNKVFYKLLECKNRENNTQTRIYLSRKILHRNDNNRGNYTQEHITVPQ